MGLSDSIGSIGSFIKGAVDLLMAVLQFLLRNFIWILLVVAGWWLISVLTKPKKVEEEMEEENNKNGIE